MLRRLCLVMALLGYVYSTPIPEGNCVDVANSIQLADGRYNCGYLLDIDLTNNRILGIYEDRVTICKQGVHQCCQACKTVISQNTNTVAPKDNCVDVANSIQLADGSYNCGYLLDLDIPDNQMLGIYEDRVNICTLGVHQCCQACKTVFSQVRAAIPINENPTGSGSVQTNSTPVKPNSSDLDEIITIATKDNCVDVANSIQFADGSYNCGYLLDLGLPDNQMLGIYKDRVDICIEGVHQCCQACKTVLSQEKDTSSTSKPVTTTSKLVTTTSKPVTTTSKPVTTTSRPVTTTSKLVTTTSKPVTTTSKPVTTTSKPETTTEKPASSDAKPDYTVQVNNGNDNDVAGTIVESIVNVNMKDPDSRYQLAAMEKRVQDKVDELQHEVDVLFASFEGHR